MTFLKFKTRSRPDSMKEKSSPHTKRKTEPVKPTPTERTSTGENKFAIITRKIDCIYGNQPAVFVNYEFYENQMINLIKIKEKIMEINDYINNPETEVDPNFDKNCIKEIKEAYTILNDKLKAEKLADITDFALSVETKQARGIGTLVEMLSKVHAETDEPVRKMYLNVCCHYTNELQRYIIVFTGLKNYLTTLT